jgi:hypothetical protein
MFDAELESFKTLIDIRGYAAAHGYVDDHRASWKSGKVMRHPATDDKIVVRRGSKGYYLWISNRNQRKGTIVDFVHYLKGGSATGRIDIGSIRKELRPWIGKPPVDVPSYAPLVEIPKDRMKVETAYAEMRDATDGHPYLERQRELPASLLRSDRFAGRIRIDGKGNAVFPHFDAEGLSGYELKNVDFTGFASGGAKALWLSHEMPDDKSLVFCESGIDALSHAALFPDNQARYASICGGLNDKQPEFIRAAIARMPHGSEIVAAMDADQAGRGYAEVVRQALELTGRGDLHFSAQEPVGFKDWNDQLRAKPLPFLPLRQKEAAPR